MAPNRSATRATFPEPVRLGLLEADADRAEESEAKLATAIDDLRDMLKAEIEGVAAEVRRNGQRSLVLAVTVLTAVLSGIIVALLAAHTIASAGH